MKLFAINFLYAFLSVSYFQVSAQSTDNGKQKIHIKRTYPSEVDSLLITKIDSAFVAAQIRFNAEYHTYSIHDTRESGPHVIELEFTRIKRVSDKGKRSAYLINGLGMVVLPVATLTAGMSMPIMVNYFPKHRIKAKMTLPARYVKQGIKAKKFNLSTGALFASKHVKVDKLVKKFSRRFYQELVSFDNKYAHSTANIGTPAVYTQAEN